MSKRIAIDCRSLEWKHSGISRYLRNILAELAKIDNQTQYFLLNCKNINNLSLTNNFKVVSGPKNFFFYKFFWTPIFIKKNSIDTYWSPTQELPLFKISSCKYIATIHDVAFEHSGILTSTNVKVLKNIGLYRTSAMFADVILTDSYYSRDDIAGTYQIPLQKIFVTYLGVDDIFRPIAKITARKSVEQTFSISSPYIFYINTGKPRNLFRAFAGLVENEWKDNKLKLVCLGNSATSDEDVDMLVETLGLQDRVIKIRSHVSDPQLVNLYAGASFFVCPSFFEGFGLTPLEALACGTPILISNVTSLPEIFDNQASYLDPYDVESIKTSLKNMYARCLKQVISIPNSELIDKYNWKMVTKEIMIHM